MNNLTDLDWAWKKVDINHGKIELLTKKWWVIQLKADDREVHTDESSGLEGMQ